MSKPLIGLNADYKEADCGNFFVVNAGYAEQVALAGGVPVIIPPIDDYGDTLIALDMLNGFILTGGSDLDPRRDGFMLHPSVRLMDSRREQFDRRLVGLLRDRMIPTLGIGAGMQLLNVHAGGTLLLDIQEDVPKAICHRDHTDPSHSHQLALSDDSWLRPVYGEIDEIRVTSMHHMAVDDLGKGFRVSATCPDGIIEGIEGTGAWVAYGIQFHPEVGAASRMDRGIFEEFFHQATGRP